MQTPEPGTGSERNEAQAGTEPGTSHEAKREHGDTDRGPATGEETGRQPYIAEEPGTTSQETDRMHATTQDGGTSEVIAGEPGTTIQEPDRMHATSQESGTNQVTAAETGTTNQDAHKEHATSQESGTTEVTAAETGTTNQVRPGEHPTNLDSGSTEVIAGEPGTTNQVSPGEHPTNLDSGSTEVTAGEPGTTNLETHGEQTSNQETDRQSDTTEAITGEAGTTDQEPATNGLMEAEEGEEEGRSDIDQENSSTEQQKVELTSAEPSTELDTPLEEKEERKVTDDADNEVTARYQETPSELPEEQEGPQSQLEAREQNEAEPEQWGQDTEPQDSSGETHEDEQVREALIQQYQALASEKEKVQQQNSQLQHKLYEYFRRKKGEETRPEIEKQVSDQEQRYLKYLATLEDMRKKFKADTILHEGQIEKLRVQCQEVVGQVDKEWAAFQEQKKKIALYIVNRGAGKRAASSFTQEVEELQGKEERKEKEVIQVRLENIKLKNQIHRHESTLRSKEELAEGLHLIDFEQLKIENQTYNEKVEERNEELLKLRKKITNTVQVLTHLKEKLQFVQAENQEQKDRLMEIEALVAHGRDILTRTKQARDNLRTDNLNLKQKCGLLGNKTLLRDFEEKVDATEELHQKLESLKRRHAELTLSSKGLMKKIEDTKFVIES
ncbi:PREDICTED: coiled-coil domain-containing protein 96 [Nanorana parkeri]|uniref:coiled-coil domain-containing protein 96 n=1 Tax=Nanorana parkeri TaxID=125878 RepID=UPI00085467CE|nr:PREDICTED: coiled-coil domain-containing protein 96 [Nanorana parkeri]